MVGRRIAYVTVVCTYIVLALAGLRAGAAPAFARSYVVRPGDTLWSIAARTGTSAGRLAAVNHLSLASVLHPGERLAVPEPAVRAASGALPRGSRAVSTAPGSAASAYVVRPGDTLWSIAARAGTSAGRLAAVNHLSVAGVIRPGERLMMPGSAPAEVRPSAAPAARPAAPPEARSEVPLPAAVPVRTSLPSRGVRFTGALVHTALRFLGRPYRWAGIGRRGFDCSGLVYRVFSAMGIRVPHSSFAQFHFGIAVPAWALAPGDLVFFHTYAWGASHVGIYLGAGRFIHASTSRGVIISSLAEPYYRYRYLGARRY